jgi:hypothetical protein
MGITQRKVNTSSKKKTTDMESRTVPTTNQRLITSSMSQRNCVFLQMWRKKAKLLDRVVNVA